MERLDREVRRELARFGPVDGDLVGIVRAWPGAVGAAVARNAWPARLARDGTLHVNAASATWAFELGSLAVTILEQLRPALGEATPKALRFTPGPVPEPSVEADARRVQTPVQPSPEHREQAAAIAAMVEDDELRELVARAAAASLAASPAGPPDDRSF